MDQIFGTHILKALVKYEGVIVTRRPPLRQTRAWVWLPNCPSAELYPIADDNTIHLP